MHALTQIQRQLNIEVVVFHDSPDFPINIFGTQQFELVFCGRKCLRFWDLLVSERFRSLTKAAHLIAKHSFINIDRPRKNTRLEKIFRAHNIEMMFYPTHRAESFETGIPFMISIHDIQHKLQSEFPEVSKFGQWKRCEYVVKNAVKNAVTIVTDSDVGKEDVVNAYGLPASKVKVLPYAPSPEYEKRPSDARIREISDKYNLPEHFAFYPAQFWPHKNHYRLVEAIHLLIEESNLSIPLIFVGHVQAQWGEFNRVMTLVRQRGLSKLVRYLEYLPSEDMPVMYRAARLLVFPTFFGPTNIPVLEAFAARCPVITSDIRGIREQVGDAAVLVDPRSVKSIATGLQEVWTNPDLRESLVENGLRRLHQWDQNVFATHLGEIISESFSELESSQRVNDRLERSFS